MGLHLNQGDDELVENHEINVTPFIDVMLVLLIIFMVAAPLATVDIKVDLPASSAKPAPRPEKPIFLSVKADQRLFLGEEEVKAETLGPVLDAKKLTVGNQYELVSRFLEGRRSREWTAGSVA